MKPIACLLVLVASLGAGPLALAQASFPSAEHAPVAKADAAPEDRNDVPRARTARLKPALVEVLGADMAATCRDSDTERARKLDAACSGKQQCRVTPEAGDAASEACARQSQLLWNCGDGLTRYVALAPAAGQSREIRLECPQNAVATAAPQASAPNASPETAKAGDAKLASKPKDITETIKVDELKLRAPRATPPALDASAVGIVREEVRMVCEAFYDPAGPELGGQRLAQLHNDIWKAPDHSPNAVGQSRQCGPKTFIPGATALPQ